LDPIADNPLCKSLGKSSPNRSDEFDEARMRMNPEGAAMEAVEFIKLTKKAVSKLLAGRGALGEAPVETGNRRLPRWPFPGTVQLWVPDEGGVEQLVLATSLNLSQLGVGIKTDDPLPVGLKLLVAIHEPEVSLQGRAIVRHCTEVDGGYYVGLEFAYDEES